MAKSFEPDDKARLHCVVGEGRIDDKTNADITLSPLTPEVLRDVARNESSPRSWRKAAIKFLIARDHKYKSHPEFRELLEEIKDEQEAEKEVQAIVESAVEEPIGSPESEQ